ncbi:MAG: hypothetical protein JNK48_23695 [Bryobacterales bacterium]|nr:hypothetical protein [Bryobacterales bacterium]
MVAFSLILLSSLHAQEGPSIFAPANETIVPPGSLRVIARAAGKATLTLDGKPVPIAQPAPGVVLAEIKLAAGPHQLTLAAEDGEAKISFFAGKEHNAWKMFQPHPPGNAACDTCHAVKNNEWALKRATLAPLCHTCHDAARFTAVHSPHNTATLVDCQNCHFPHGSPASKHLRMEKAVACKQCHS